MSKKTYRVDVIKTVDVEFDMDKLDDEFWEEFNRTIDDRGGPDPQYLAEHAAWNWVQGEERFIEGIGDLKKMNVKISDVDSEVDSREI